MREQRKEELQQHIRDVNKEFRKMNPDLSSDDGLIEQTAPASIVPEEQEEEYVDEDKYTTVTVEAMGEESEDEDAAQKPSLPSTAPQSTTKTKPSVPAKKKRKKFRYESKAERQETRRRQKAKNSREAKARKEK